MARHRYQVEITYEKLVIELYQDSKYMDERTETLEFETMNKQRAKTKARKTISSRIGPNDRIVSMDAERIENHVGLDSDTDDDTDDSDDGSDSSAIGLHQTIRGAL